MKSLKNHLSLILAIFTILFTVQIFFIVDRSIEAYEENLRADYSIVVIASKAMSDEVFASIDPMIKSSEPIDPSQILERLKGEMKQKNIDLLKVTLPKFYRLHLNRFPSPGELSKLSERLRSDPLITRVESFAENHDTVYKLLLLFKSVTQIFAVAIFAVTSLLILKEMRIWQFQHHERMNIMALFGAPVWLRSAVLFRLAIVDALIAAGLIVGTFFAIIKQGWIEAQLREIGIEIALFNLPRDGLVLLGIALILSIFLASMIVLGHKEEA